MSQQSDYEQLMLELINAERAKVGAQPLSFNSNLNSAAENHSLWMTATDTFSHTGDGGSSPTYRMTMAGYQFTSASASAENIAWASIRAPVGLQDEVELLHKNLMGSPGHKANILNDTYRQIGVGFTTGEYQGWDGAFVTQNFALSGTFTYLTGVAFRDKDGDRFYDVGEGLGGLSVTAVTAAGAVYKTATLSTGGYDLALPSGTYSVTISGGGVAEQSYHVSIGSKNVKLDVINPAAPVYTPTPVPLVENLPSGTLSLTGSTGQTDIYRFFRADNGFHFFTASEAERDSIIANLPHYKYEGNAFDTTATAQTGDEVFRFFRADNGTHFYTISEAERDSIIANLPHYKYEGAAYHAYETNVGGGHEELYRFFRADNGTHFFTASEAERDSILANLPHYKYEGIAYYVDFA
jgi:hypothetical protein